MGREGGMGAPAMARTGAAATRPRGDAANATKWLNRTAQGFSPGLAPKKIALKGRPTGHAGQARASRTSFKILGWRKDGQTRFSFGRPFKARPRSSTNPGLKPWAILFSHFVAITRAPSPFRPFAV